MTERFELSSKGQAEYSIEGPYILKSKTETRTVVEHHFRLVQEGTDWE